MACPPKLEGDGSPGPCQDPLPAELLDLYDLHGPRLLRFALLSQPAEVAQEGVRRAFLALWHERRSGHAPEPLASWLLREVRKFLGDRSRLGPDSLPHVSNPLQRFGLLSESLRVAWPQLPDLLSPREYEILLMRMAGFSYSEIASTLEITTGTVGSMLTRAWRKIAPHPPLLP